MIRKNTFLKTSVSALLFSSLLLGANVVAAEETADTATPVVESQVQDTVTETVQTSIDRSANANTAEGQEVNAQEQEAVTETSEAASDQTASSEATSQETVTSEATTAETKTESTSELTESETSQDSQAATSYTTATAAGQESQAVSSQAAEDSKQSSDYIIGERSDLNYQDNYYTYTVDGENVKNTWVEISDDQIMYFGADGHSVSGLQTVDSKNYFFGKFRVMVSLGQFKGYTDSDVYNIKLDAGDYLKKGKKIADSEGNTYYTNKDTGEIATGWIQYDESYLYADKNGVLQTGSTVINGRNYYFDKDGKQVKGAFVTTENGKTYFYEGHEGRRVSNSYVTEGGKWYYVDAKGQKVTGHQTINGQEVYFDDNGVQAKDGWQTDKEGKTYYYDKNSGQLAREKFVETTVSGESGYWSYVNKNGNKVTGFYQASDGNTYYFDELGRQVKGATGTYGGKSVSIAYGTGIVTFL
ncbi:hypothetical protein [Streptococcus dentiloxodontae]